MTIDASRYLGGAGTTVADSSWSFVLTASPAIGEVGIVWLATNNAATADGPSNTHTSLSGGGLDWQKLAEVTASSGAAEDGVTVSAWLSSVSTTSAGSMTLTAGFSQSISSKVAQGRAIAGSALGVDALSARTNYASAQYGEMTFSGLSSKERLWLRISGGEYGASTNATRTDTSWTIGGGINIGSATSGMMGRHEWTVESTGGATSSFTQNIAVDSASIFVALSEGGGMPTERQRSRLILTPW